MFSGAAKPQWICIRKENEACLSLEFTAQLASSNKSESRIVPVYFPRGDFRPVLLLCHIWFVKFQSHMLVTYYIFFVHIYIQIKFYNTPSPRITQFPLTRISSYTYDGIPRQLKHQYSPTNAIFVGTKMHASWGIGVPLKTTDM